MRINWIQVQVEDAEGTQTHSHGIQAKFLVLGVGFGTVIKSAVTSHKQAVGIRSSRLLIR